MAVQLSGISHWEPDAIWRHIVDGDCTVQSTGSEKLFICGTTVWYHPHADAHCCVICLNYDVSVWLVDTNCFRLYLGITEAPSWLQTGTCRLGEHDVRSSSRSRSIEFEGCCRSQQWYVWFMRFEPMADRNTLRNYSYLQYFRTLSFRLCVLRSSCACSSDTGWYVLEDTMLPIPNSSQRLDLYSTSSNDTGSMRT